MTPQTDHSAPGLSRILLQLEIDALAAFLDGAVRDPEISEEEVMAAALRYASLLIQFKALGATTILPFGGKGRA